VKKLREVYVMSWPTYYARGIFFGKLVMELGGKAKIRCKETGYSAYINFKTKVIFQH
jgi:hypothetical protein